MNTSEPVTKPEHTNTWGNTLVTVLTHNANRVLFKCPSDRFVYECMRAVWDIRPLPRNLRPPE